MSETKIITKNWDKIDPFSLESYKKKGGYKALRKALRDFSPDGLVSEIKNSLLQGRGGAGFPVGQKWEIAKNAGRGEKYFICNLDESEPGTFKDRMLAEKNPHQIIEGVLIASYAIGAKKAYIYLNGKFNLARVVLQKAMESAQKEGLIGKSIAGFAFDLEIKLVVGAGAYICGEESALINSIEGKRGEPRSKPPYPCNCGLFGRPTVVNNAETICNLPWIVDNGAEKYRKIGLKDSPGTKLFSIDGAVKKPGLYEAPIGTSINELIHKYAQGLQSGAEIFFVNFGGSSGRIIPAGYLDEVPSFSKKSKVPMASGSVLVVDKGQDAKNFLLGVVKFFQRESCGKCVPCREGTFRLRQMIQRLSDGQFDQNDKEDLPKLIWILDNTTFCPLGKFSVTALKDIIKYKLIKELN